MWPATRERVGGHCPLPFDIGLESYLREGWLVTPVMMARREQLCFPALCGESERQGVLQNAIEARPLLPSELHVPFVKFRDVVISNLQSGGDREFDVGDGTLTGGHEASVRSLTLCRGEVA